MREGEICWVHPILMWVGPNGQKPSVLKKKHKKEVSGVVGYHT